MLSIIIKITSLYRANVRQLCLQSIVKDSGFLSLGFSAVMQTPCEGSVHLGHSVDLGHKEN